MLVASLALAALALGLRLVAPREVPGLLDLDLLSLFAVLIVAVACARRSGLFDWLVARALSRVRSERSLAATAILLTGALSAAVTNDVALLLVVPFTLAFERADPSFDTGRVVILEIAAANLLGALAPTGNPQNLFLYARGGFTAPSFFAAQVPWVGAMAVVLLGLVPVLIPRRALAAPPAREIPVQKRLALGGKLLLVVQLLALFGQIPRFAPLLASVPVALLLGRDLLRVDFSLVAVFSALFVAVEGLRRSPLFGWVDPVTRFGATPEGFVLSGALLSQAVSNVPAAILLAPAAASAGGGVLFTALLYGVNAGGAGTPVSSLANLIGADLYLRGRETTSRFWVWFGAVSAVLLVAGLGISMLLLRFAARGAPPP